MVDVAKLAGVSYQTVSRVLHQSPHVSSETRTRVETAIRALDYRPSSVAQALVTGRSKILGVVSFDTTLFGPASTLLGVEEAAHDSGYVVVVTSLKTIDSASVMGAVERLRDQGVDGIVVIAPKKSAIDALRRLPSALHVVAVEAGPGDAVPVVAVDQQSGAAAATRHLLELGHKTVWHIAGPRDWIEAGQRIKGWREALRVAGAKAPPLLYGDWGARSGYELGQRILREPEVTAVFVSNDQMALGLLRRLHEAGRQVPREISVVGFDDIPESAYFTPPLTTVRQNFAEVGRLCLRLLVDQIENGVSARSESIVPAELIVRQSTAAAHREN